MSLFLTGDYSRNRSDSNIVYAKISKQHMLELFQDKQEFNKVLSLVLLNMHEKQITQKLQKLIDTKRIVAIELNEPKPSETKIRLHTNIANEVREATRARGFTLQQKSQDKSIPAQEVIRQETVKIEELTEEEYSDLISDMQRELLLQLPKTIAENQIEVSRDSNVTITTTKVVSERSETKKAALMGHKHTSKGHEQHEKQLDRLADQKASTERKNKKDKYIADLSKEKRETSKLRAAEQRTHERLKGA